MSALLGGLRLLQCFSEGLYCLQAGNNRREFIPASDLSEEDEAEGLVPVKPV